MLEKADTECLLELTLPSSLLYFKGHFDRFPILPGVVQIDWVIAFGKEFLGIRNLFSEMRQLKFQQMVRPDSTVRLSLAFSKAANTLSFRYFSDDGRILSTGKINYLPLAGEAD